MVCEVCVCGVWGYTTIHSPFPFEDDIELRPDLGDLNSFLSPYSIKPY